jgi:hypothetical protein
VATVAKRAGIGHVHPHQLRHTLATQSINRGMSLESIAALLGHRSMDMTLTYARISDDTVAAAYFKVTEAVEAQYYGLSGAAPVRTASSSAQSVSDHHRLLANGHCTRPAILGCAFETSATGGCSDGKALSHSSCRDGGAEIGDSGGLRPSRSASRITQSARNWDRCNQASGRSSSTSCSRSTSLRRAFSSSVTCINDATRSWRSRCEVWGAKWYGYPSFI